MEVLGISSNTWLKVKKGEPIRASVAARLLLRLDSQGMNSLSGDERLVFGTG